MKNKDLSALKNIKGPDRAVISGLKISQIEIEKEDYSEAGFSECAFRKTILKNLSLHGAAFVRSKLSKVSFNNVILKQATFTESNLSNSTFSNCDIRNASFINSNLSGTQFNNSNLESSLFINSICYKTELRNANLKNSMLIDSDFSYSDLSNTDLSEADLSLSYFYGANMSGAKLDNATVMNASFERVKGLNKDQQNYIKENGGAVSPAISILIADIIPRKKLPYIAVGLILFTVIVAVIGLNFFTNKYEKNQENDYSLTHTIRPSGTFAAISDDEKSKQLSSGLVAQYFIAENTKGEPSLNKIVNGFRINTTTSPVNPDSLPVIRFHGYLSAPESKTYNMKTGFDDHLTLFIDDKEIMSKDGTDEYDIFINLEKGFHKISGVFKDYGGQFYFRFNPNAAGLMPFHDAAEDSLLQDIDGD